MLDMEILTFRGLQHRKAMSLQFRRTSLGIKEDSHIWVLTILSLKAIAGLQYFSDGAGRVMAEDLLEVVEHVVVGGRGIAHHEILRFHFGKLGHG